MTIRTVTSHVLNLHGAARVGDTVRFRLLDGMYTSTAHVPADVQTATIDASGNISIVLYCPANYDCIIANAMRFQFTLPDSAVATTLEALHASGEASPTATNALQTLIDVEAGIRAAADVVLAAALAAAPADSLTGLTDVTLTSPTTGQVLRKSAGDWVNATLAFADVGSVPTTLAGYGITDAYTKTAADARYAPIAVPFASLTGLPTTLAGYGIVDSLTAATAAATYSVLAHTHTFASLTSKPTTLAGYGIADAYTTTQVDSADALKANLAGGNTLTGAQILASSAVGVKPLIVKGFAGQTASLQEWTDSTGVAKASVDVTGTFVALTLLTNSATSQGLAVYAKASAASHWPLWVRGAASQTADLTQWQSSAGTVLCRINKNGYRVESRTTAIPDGDLNTSEMALWLTDTPGGTVFNVKAKDSAGTVRTGTLALT